MEDTKMKTIIENMESMVATELMDSNGNPLGEMNIAGVASPLGMTTRSDSVGPGMDLPVEGSDQPKPNADDEIGESLSQGAVDRLMDAMLHSPRMGKMMERYGLDELAAERLRIQLTPVMKMFFASEGIGVSGISSAKAAVRAFGRGK